MKKKFHIRFNSEDEPELLRVLKENKIRFKSVQQSQHRSLIALDIIEGGSHWSSIAPLLKPKNFRLSLNYSPKEMREAKWFSIYPTNRFGYPQPEDVWYPTHFTHKNYDFDSGIYSEQIKPFEIKDEPKTKNVFSSLYWTEEIFVKKFIISMLNDAGITGWKKWPVLIHKTKQPSKTISQLEIMHVLHFEGVMDEHKRYVTESGFEKYVRNSAAPYLYTNELLNIQVDMVLSKEIFGAAKNAARICLVSKKFYDLFKQHKWMGLQFEPVHIVKSS